MFSYGRRTTSEDVGLVWLHHRRYLECTQSAALRTADLMLPLPNGFVAAHTVILLAFPPNHTFTASKLVLGGPLPAPSDPAAIFPYP